MKQFILTSILFFFVHTAMAFDVGGLVSDGNGGYSDTGFGGIAGSGDLGISDGDLGGGFGVSSDSSSGSNAGSIGDGIYGGGGSDSAAGGQTSNGASDTISSVANMMDQMVTNSVPVADRKAVRGLTFSLYSDRAVSLAEIEASGLVDQDTMDGMWGDFFGEVGGFIDGYSQFGGGIHSGPINIAKYTIHQNSENIVNWLVNNYRKSSLNGPLSRVGMIGVTIVVMQDLPSSFYAKGPDTIYLAHNDVKKYGLAVLYHELLHAGLHKAKKSGTITPWLHNRLSELNVERFSKLNGYIGTSQGAYETKGYGYQEAFVIGWSFVKLKAALSSIPNDTLRKRAAAYKNSILENSFLTRLNNGKTVRMIDSNKMSKAEVRQKFLQPFLNKDSRIRRKIARVQDSSREELPYLCAPASRKVTNKVSCNSNTVVYQRSYSYDVQICGSDFRYGETIKLGCGAVIGYKGP